MPDRQGEQGGTGGDGERRRAGGHARGLPEQLDLDALAGSFAVESVTPPEGEVQQVSLSVTLTPVGMMGTLSGMLVISDGQVAQAGGVTFASWPESAACPPDFSGAGGIPVAADHVAFGLSGEQAIEQFNAASPLTLAWDDGASTELSLTAVSSGDGCLRVDPYAYLSGHGGASLSFPITLSAVTDDGELDGSYETTLILGRLAGSNDHSVDVQLVLPLELDDVAQSGLKDVSLPEGLHRLAFALNAELVDGEVSGELGLNGLTDPPCVTDPPEPGPNGAPGCEGTHVTELVSGSF